ncbi:Multidrug resistance-associated protein 1, partial [Podila clonocystis]
AYYLRTSNVLRRLDAVARSPLYQHFTETLNGVSSIRAMQLSSVFTAKNDSHANTSSNGNYAVLMNNRWLASRIEILASIVILFSALLIVFSRGAAGLD